ncbi:hypothetical protein H6F75_26050 [Nodosilinea sp. FACHB-131]|uniref:hypothetical protein n=1 Tax=Cyanophyceae TaxID=3028117 RepID=UPI0016833DF3|nr:hypothetical protein [Nodosilinea sp. FACHB-131]MBD1876952.1 hypothetical protein [Nodosilinea sp. FACHB-131]
MSYITLQIEENDHLRQTPPLEDIENILSLLGHSRIVIASARITVLPSCVTVRWTNQIAA